MSQISKRDRRDKKSKTFTSSFPNILIVDDRKENLLATEKVLKPLAVNIFLAASGNEALSLILRHRFAVVLLDVQMPEMDGFETALLMQEHEPMRGVPIIFVTAISKEERYATQAAELGAVDYIFKPINPEILKSKVNVYLDIYIQREQIIALNKSLRQTNEELERFAYICSHDLQEPVRMMNNYASLLEEECFNSLDDNGKKFLKFIIKNASRMQKMILDILTFARVGREEIKLEPVDFNIIVKEVIEELDECIKSKKAKIHYSNLPVIKTSQTLVRILLQNLIGNALKFQNKDCIPEISIKSERSEQYWKFFVKDNGIGIEPEFHEKVFTIFQRFHSRDEYPGTGIGLSTCRKFLQLCGGDIGFESVAKKGSVFFFTIPQKE